MGRKLSKYDDEAARAGIEASRLVIEMSLAEAPPDDDGLASGYAELGACLYQLEADFAEVRAALSTAAEHAAPGVERQAPPEPLQSRLIWNFTTPLGLVCAYGTPEQRQRMGRIPREKIHFPPNRRWDLIADGVEVLQGWLANGQADRALAAQVLERAEQDNASRNDRGWARPLAEATLALEDRDAARLLAALKTIAQAHKYLATVGDWRQGPDSLLCPLGLGLVQLGRELGLSVDPESPYIPLEALPTGEE